MHLSSLFWYRGSKNTPNYQWTGIGANPDPTAVDGGTRVTLGGHRTAKSGLMPMVGFSGKLQDQAGLEIGAHQTKPKFRLFLFCLMWTPRKAGVQVLLCCRMPVLNPSHIFGVFWACSHKERPNAMRNMSRIWPRTGSAYYWINWAMSIVVVGKCSEGKVASRIPKIESKRKYFYFACQISITSQNNWASWFN